MHKSGLTVKKQSRQPIDRSWKDTSLEYADPTAAKRTKRAVRKRVPKQLLPKDKRKTAKDPLAVDIQGKGSKPTSKVREQQKAEKMKADTAAYQKKYLAKPKVKEKPIQKFETIEAEGGGKVQYRSIGGIVGRSLGKSIKSTAKKGKRKVQKGVDKVLHSSRDAGPDDAPGVTAGGRTSKSAVIGRHRVADYTKKRRVEGFKAGTGVGVAGSVLVNSLYDSKEKSNKVIDSRTNTSTKMKNTSRGIQGTPAEIARDRKRKKKTEKYGGGKVQYRSIGGKVVDGNDITGMIYD